METRFKKECYLIRQYDIKCFDKIYLVGEDESKLQKQISKLFVLTEMAAWLKLHKKMMT